MTGQEARLVRVEMMLAELVEWCRLYMPKEALEAGARRVIEEASLELRLKRSSAFRAGGES